MKINDLNMDKSHIFTNVQCEMVIKKKIQSNIGQIEFENNSLKFISEKEIILFKINENDIYKKVVENLRLKLTCFGYITNYNEEKKVFFLRIIFFYDYKIWDKISVIIDDDLKEKIIKKYYPQSNDLKKDLEQNFTFYCRNLKYFAYEKKDYELEGYKNEKNIIKILGEKFDIYLSINEEKNDGQIQAIEIANKSYESSKIRLINGSIDFFDNKSFLSKTVKETLENTKGYIELWNQYANQEGDLLLDKVRKIGIINLKLEDQAYTKDGIYVPYTSMNKEKLDLIENDSYILFSDEEPIYLKNEKMNWQEYRKYQKNNTDTKDEKLNIKVLYKRDNGFILEAENNILPKKKFISYSILGDEKQISRREDARLRIQTGEAANPIIGLILEGKSFEKNKNYNKNNISPLSSFVMEKIFKYPPTNTQERAIDIALNTPDIAIIQGPPGTGKTTVITAIIERLNEICDKNSKIDGQVLITSFQHDAVKNVIERLNINSLPTIKFGKRENEIIDDSKEKIIEEWCDEYSNKIRIKNPEILETEDSKMFSNYYDIYLAYPNKKNKIEFLEYAKKVCNDKEILNKIYDLLNKENLNEDIKESDIVPYIRKIRTTKEGFLDDGQINSAKLLLKLNEINFNNKIKENNRVYEVLEKSISLDKLNINLKILEDLKEIKKYLLNICIPEPVYNIEIPDMEINELYLKINPYLKKTENEESTILVELLNELNYNRREVEKSLEHYLFVYAATTQQSEGKEIKKAKNLKKGEFPEYDTVIVDEAARVNPPDLMIPLSQAKKRIILVGDHRQLPHIYSEEVFESLKENGETLEINNIKCSMFEYLLNQAKKLEKIDNVQRTIVLDAQYRMHPILGEFINENFYKPYEESFSSPLPAENYIQKITKKDFPIEWYDISSEYGKEKKIGTSRIRECEAEFIAKKIKEYLDKEEGKTLTYGVITFYSAQVNCIKLKLKDFLGEDAKKIKVGSVDAFQGMEFDVIFLSIVRCNTNIPMVKIDKESERTRINYNYLEQTIDNTDKKKYEEYLTYKEKVGLQNFGFLIYENRLCVSLSRQKKALIIVGSSNMFCGNEWGKLSEIFVPSIKKMYELCKKESVIYSEFEDI